MIIDKKFLHVSLFLFGLFLLSFLFFSSFLYSVLLSLFLSFFNIFFLCFFLSFFVSFFFLSFSFFLFWGFVCFFVYFIYILSFFLPKQNKNMSYIASVEMAKKLNENESNIYLFALDIYSVVRFRSNDPASYILAHDISWLVHSLFLFFYSLLPIPFFIDSPCLSFFQFLLQSAVLKMAFPPTHPWIYFLKESKC